MSTESRVARLFGLRGTQDWTRHANPLSVYTRIPIPLLIVAAIWTYTWFGWWSLIPVVIVLIWMVVNPRVFPPPESIDHWASRAVLGETYWATRKESPVPKRHRVAPLMLGTVSAAGVPFIIWGVIVLDPWITGFGLALQTIGKLWFLDRMALLYDDIQTKTPSRRIAKDHARQPNSRTDVQRVREDL